MVLTTRHGDVFVPKNWLELEVGAKEGQKPGKVTLRAFLRASTIIKLSMIWLSWNTLRWKEDTFKLA